MGFWLWVGWGAKSDPRFPFVLCRSVDASIDDGNDDIMRLRRKAPARWEDRKTNAANCKRHLIPAWLPACLRNFAARARRRRSRPRRAFHSAAIALRKSLREVSPFTVPEICACLPGCLAAFSLARSLRRCGGLRCRRCRFKMRRVLSNQQRSARKKERKKERERMCYLLPACPFAAGCELPD